MGLTIDMCRDVENYEEGVVMGLNAKKSICVIIAAFTGAGIVALFYKVFKWSLLVSVYAMIPFCGVIILSGFYTSNGLTFWQMIRRKLKKVNEKPLFYKSTECRSVYESAAFEPADSIVTAEDKRSEIDRMMKKLKLCLAAAGVIIVLGIALIVIFSR